MRRIRVGEVGFRFQRFRYRPMLTELSTVIERDGVAKLVDHILSAPVI